MQADRKDKKMNPVDKDLKEIGFSYEELAQVRNWLADNFNLTLNRVPRKGWLVAGLVKGVEGAQWGTLWIGLALLRDLLLAPEKFIRENAHYWNL